jgi:uncharacterized Zn finger protein
MSRIACPRCGQDWVRRAVIKPLKEEIVICPECDAFWRPDQPISKDNFSDYGTYIESKGYTDGWDLLQIVDADGTFPQSE